MLCDAARGGASPVPVGPENRGGSALPGGAPGGEGAGMRGHLLHRSAAGRGADAAGPGSGRAGWQRRGKMQIDLSAAMSADRACCCPAKPVVVAIIPPGPGRPRPGDLLLCGHHYRVSRQALAAQAVTVVDIEDGQPAEDAWPLARTGV